MEKQVKGTNRQITEGISNGLKMNEKTLKEKHYHTGRAFSSIINPGTRGNKQG